MTQPVKGEKITYLTKEGLAALKVELEMLKNEKRREVAQRLKDAIALGDLSENSEYDAARSEQAFLEKRISDIEQMLKSAQVITHKKKDVIELGSRVTVRNVTQNEKAETYTIVGATEANPLAHTISNVSPLGSAVIGRMVHEKVAVVAPKGTSEYEIVAVE